VTNDDVIFRMRVRTLALAQEIGVGAACRMQGIHRSTYYRWKRVADRHGLDLLRPRERRTPRMPNAVPAHIEQRVIGLALAFPGNGPQFISDQLRREKWGGIKISANGVHRVLRRHGLNTRSKRLGLVAGYAAPPETVQLNRDEEEPERHLEVDRPGQMIQFDCFYVGRLAGSKGVCWQYTATDVYSAFTWAELHNTDRVPAARFTSALARRVAAELADRGWRPEVFMTDNGSEFRSADFDAACRSAGVEHRRIRAGRPQTNGCVERVQQTILNECWKPAFARFLIPRYTGLRRDLDDYLCTYNTDRPHRGRHTKGRTPDEVLGKGKMWR
jgi:transposase InsO family protein